MQLIVNGASQEVTSEISVSQLLQKMEIMPDRIAVEVNMEIIEKKCYGEKKLLEGDQVEIIGFVGGGSYAL
ncbi:MAG: sulfur carrier protein ThiS [Nitrospiria bacterium]